jgi:hypothetical protein
LSGFNKLLEGYSKKGKLFRETYPFPINRGKITVDIILCFAILQAEDYSKSTKNEKKM